MRYTGAPPFVTEIATGMERDMQGSVVATLVLIVLLFWWAHRSWRPLMFLVLMLALVVAGALASGVAALNLGPYGIIAILTVVYALNIADRFSISTVIEPIRLELHLSDSGVAFLTGTIPDDPRYVDSEKRFKAATAPDAGVVLWDETNQRIRHGRRGS